MENPLWSFVQVSDGTDVFFFLFYSLFFFIFQTNFFYSFQQQHDTKCTLKSITSFLWLSFILYFDVSKFQNRNSLNLTTTTNNYNERPRNIYVWNPKMKFRHMIMNIILKRNEMKKRKKKNENFNDHQCLP